MSRLQLIAVGGAPATGKTTVTKQLEQEQGFARVAMDEIKETFFDLFGSRDREWSKSIGRIAFPVFQKMIELHLERGESVLAESTFLWKEDAEWLEKLSKDYQAELRLIWLTADPAIARERFIHRATSGERHPGHNDALTDVLAEFDERFFSTSHDPLPIHAPTLIVDTTSFSDVDMQAIRNFIV